MARVELHLFGAPRIECDGAAVAVERRKTLALLSYLAVTGQAHRREALATLLWPELDASHGRGQLRNSLVDLQRAIGAGWLDAEGDQVGLVGGLWVDVSRFRELLVQAVGHNHPPQRLCAACQAALGEAAGLYAADFLAGFTLPDAEEFDAWQTFQTESLRLELAGVLEKLAQGLAGSGQWEAAIGHARRWLAFDPLNEPAQRLLMQLYAGVGDRAAAVRQYQECLQVLHAELGIDPEPETKTLFEAIRTADTSLLQLTLPPAPTHNLPPDLTPFIGRETELVQIVDRLSHPACRLLTVVGPGGIGKTRLAIQAARSVVDSFVHGACFVDLAPTSSPEQLAPAILDALKIPTYASAQADQQVLGHLADKHMLLVLDNYEHLLRGREPGDRDGEMAHGMRLLMAILRGAPKVKLLVTSRIRLNVQSEWVEVLEGLTVPTSVDREDTEVHAFAVQPTTLECYGATALFLLCVSRVQLDFRPTAYDAGCIVRICRLLAGVPLAIELAAAWTRALPLSEIEAELERGLALLVTTLREAPARHRSMLATFDHSWRLLTPKEHSILRQLSVFRGGFTREAAQAVTGATLVDLAALIDASWLRLGLSGRYQFHELMRQFCVEKLDTEHAEETGEPPDRARDRHADYFQSLARQMRVEWGRALKMAGQLTPEMNNFLAAREWHAARDRVDAALEISGMLGWFGYRMGWYASMVLSLERSIRQLESRPVGLDDPRHLERALLLGALHNSLADCCLMQLSCERVMRHLRQAECYLEQGPEDDLRWREARWRHRRTLAFANDFQGDFAESARLWEPLRNELCDPGFRLYPYAREINLRARAETYWGQAGGAYRMGHYGAAQRLCEESLALCDRYGLELGQGLTHRVLALVSLAIGAYQEAEAHGRAALAIIRAVGDRPLTAEFYNLLGGVHCARGDYERAAACHRRSLSIATAIGHGFAISHARRGLADIALAQGRPAAARQLFEQILAAFEHTGTGWPMGPALVHIGLGQAALAMRDPVEARRRFLLVVATERSTAGQRAQGVAGLGEARLAEGQLTAAVELLAFIQAWPSAFHVTRQRAVRLLAELEAKLPAEEFAAAGARGRVREFDEIVAALVGG